MDLALLRFGNQLQQLKFGNFQVTVSIFNAYVIVC